MTEANSKTHDLPEGEIIVPVQHMWPNCRKYSKCCSDNQEFWDELQKRLEEWKPKKQPFRTLTVKSNLGKAPEGFEGW